MHVLCTPTKLAEIKTTPTVAETPFAVQAFRVTHVEQKPLTTSQLAENLSPASPHRVISLGKASVMMDLITLFSELVATFIILVTRPFSLFKLACFFAMKTVFILIHTWMELVRATFGFHVNLFSRIIMLTVTLISLPARILNALKRERQFQDLKNENLRLKEIKDEGYWSIKGPDDMGNGQNTGISESSGIPCGISSWKSSYNGSGIFLQDPMMSKDTWVDEGVMDPRLTCSRSHSPECTKRREEE
ncbi:uncharacterized protein LOC108995522 isoform X7 [Juglans regia]|uniref:Uncharacterized protein LOC108995522 isoform X7 n=1 Tax=Juglans regia TaxID=51240 RepID=A0A6P9E8M8_JUGRE|nr:uncharacterized protein LOC108995522 isoform X7 [Juglans regia]